MDEETKIENKTPQKQEIIFGTWNIRARSQYIIYLLEYCHVPYTMKVYETLKQKDWIIDKENIGFNFPNLPYILKGDLKLTESTAIMRWVAYEAKEPSLLGKNEYEEAKVVNLYTHFENLIKRVTLVCKCNKNRFEEIKNKELQDLKTNFKDIEKFLKEKVWLMGYLTIADFILVFLMEWVLALDKRYFSEFEMLKKYYDRFFMMRSMKEYKKSKKMFKKFIPEGFTWIGPE